MQGQEVKTVEKELNTARNSGEYSDTQPSFDVDRVAKELDNVFSKVYKDHLQKTEANKQQHLQALENISKNKISEFRAIILNDVLPNIKDALIAEIEKGREVIHLPDSREISISNTDHPKVSDVIKSLHMQKKAMLVGPAGTGKTYMIADIATKLELPFYKYSCSRDSSVHDLLGYKQPTS